MAVNVEDQLMLGNEIMIAPVYTQNAIGRYVYLPEAMMLVRFCPDGKIEQTEMPKGHHFVEVPLNEVILFIRQGKCIPLVDAAECVDEIDMDSLQLIGYANSTQLVTGLHKLIVCVFILRHIQIKTTVSRILIQRILAE